MGQVGSVKRAKQAERPEVNDMLEIWIQKAMAAGLHVTGQLLRQKWTQFADRVGVPDDERLKLSEGWLTALKNCCGLKEFKRHGEAASANKNDVEHKRARIQDVIAKSGLSLRDIFNMDETGLYYA